MGLVIARGDDDDGETVSTENYAPDINPAEFTTKVDNRYFPLTPGTKWVYEGTNEDGDVEKTVVHVTNDTKKVAMGVETVVVRDTVSIDGEVQEDTYDWYAQDADGNVWYFGEDSKEYEDGKVSSSGGSWEAGVDGAQPGIIMKADPKVGDKYKQEFYKGEAEDEGEVIAVGQKVTVKTGSYDDVLVTADTNPLEPDVIEHKSYAPGVGVVKEETVQGDQEKAELVELTQP